MAPTIRPARASSASALAALCALVAHAAAADPTLVRDERGLSLFNAAPARGPSGFLYEWPYEPRPRLALEAGALGRDGSAPRIVGYRDYREGLFLNHVLLSAGRFELDAARVGRRDQSYRAAFGAGIFGARLFYDEIPTLITDQARTVFRAAGSGNLTLVPGLVPGNNTAAQLNAALSRAQPFELGLRRRSGGLEFEAAPSERWRVFARYALERKDGTRPSGGASSYPGAPLAELIEPIDYKTHQLAGGVQWVGERLQANLEYTGSVFRNGIDTLTWENALLVGDPAVMQRGRIDLYPGNESHHAKLDFAALLPLRARLTGGVALGRMTQNDALVPPVVNSGMVGIIDLAQWDTAAALSQRTANARIDTQLAHAGLGLAPFAGLSLQAKWRRYDEDNRTSYSAFNPQSGESGYLGNDGALINTVPNNIFRVQLRSMPFECARTNRSLEGDYQLLRRTSFTLGYERAAQACRHRERQSTDEGRWRASLSNRAIPWATLRLSYEQAKRTGDDYNHEPNAAYYANSAFLDIPATLAQLRKHDLADREQRIARARVNFLLGDAMDLALSGRYEDNEYGAHYGRLAKRVQAFNVEWNWQARPRVSAYAHYGFERLRQRMALISDDVAGYFSGDPNAGGAVYPLANRWEDESRDDAHLVGLGLRYGLGAVTLEGGYTYLYSPYRSSYAFASPGALVGGAPAAAAAGDAMPVITFRQHALETSLRYKVSRNAALRLYLRYERARFDDWHYDALPYVLGSEAVFLGAGPRDYSVSLAGLFFQYTAR
jgi:MtrB/PioB family decaheme-associated outer membrane protein